MAPEKNSKLRYDFRVGNETPLSEVKEHVSDLMKSHPYMFDDIDPENLYCLFDDKDPQKKQFVYEAVNILTAACETVQIVLDKKQENNKPVYLPLPEFHHLPGFKAHNMLVTKSLLKLGHSMSLGIEQPKQNITQYFIDLVQNKTSKPLRNEEIEAVKKYADREDLHTDLFFIYGFQREAPYSQKILEHFMFQTKQKYGCPVEFTDAPRKEPGRQLLDEESEEYKELNDEMTDIDIASPKGFHIRNTHMINHTPQADIMTQLCGKFHVHDEAHPETQNSQTLIACARNSMDCTPVGRYFFYTAPPYKPPEGLEDHMDDIHLSPGFAYHYYKHEKFPDKYTAIHGKEPLYVHTVFPALGIGDVLAEGILNKLIQTEEKIDHHANTVLRMLENKRNGSTNNDLPSPDYL